MHWECRCGAFEAEVNVSRGTRAVCYCPSCREFAHRTNADSDLDSAGGADLLQVAPEDCKILKGAENLTWMRLTPKGPLRWYTTCCNSPVANTLTSRTVPFLTLMTPGFENQKGLAPVDVRVNRRHASGRVPDDSKGAGHMFVTFAGRVLRSFATGGWRRNPFFDAAGNPVASGKTFHD